VIYRMHHYPVHLIDIVRLVGGSRVTVRPALPQDADLQRAFFRALSPEARYHRFMTRLNDVTDDLAERFSSIDYCNHVALLAEIFTDAGETMIGEARYVVDAHDPGVCEVAIAVADAWRGTGLARTLLQRLVRHAATAGIRCMVADTIASNAAMIALAERAGFAVTPGGHDARLMRLSKDLAAEPRASAPGKRHLDRATAVRTRTCR
jgi:acetyltransferase